jgi:hypothetical protein
MCARVRKGTSTLCGALARSPVPRGNTQRKCMTCSMRNCTCHCIAAPVRYVPAQSELSGSRHRCPRDARPNATPEVSDVRGRESPISHVSEGLAYVEVVSGIDALRSSTQPLIDVHASLRNISACVSTASHSAARSTFVPSRCQTAAFLAGLTRHNGCLYASSSQGQVWVPSCCTRTPLLRQAIGRAPAGMLLLHVQAPYGRHQGAPDGFTQSSHICIWLKFRAVLRLAGDVCDPPTARPACPRLRPTKPQRRS